MPLPHNFPSLTEGQAQTVAVCGTGLSAPTAPTVPGLTPKMREVAESLGVQVGPNDDFYVLAGRCIDSLTANNARTDALARLELAEQLGLLDDQKWFGSVGVPLLGNTPRHRVLARLAVEQRIRAVVSLNWDTLLEAALESAGLEATCMTPRPWKMTTHSSVVVDTHLSRLASDRTFPVYKPHGCVRDLEKARQRWKQGQLPQEITFKLTEVELDELPNGQSLVDQAVQGHLAVCPLIAVGWKASERYLRETVIRAALVNNASVDAFTLISRSWYPNGAGQAHETYHGDIATAYNRTQANSFASVNNAPVDPSMDCLLLWIYARYALRRLFSACIDPDVKAALQQLADNLSIQKCDDPLIAFCDYWLPSWVTICWRAGAMQAVDPDTGQQISASDIPLSPRDIHIPLMGLAQVRHDLVAAALLLRTIHLNLAKLDFMRFPGAMFNGSIGRLYVLFPGWSSGAPLLDTEALQPLLRSISQIGFVQEIRLVFLMSDAPSIDDSVMHQAVAQVTARLPISGWTERKSISWISVGDLAGDLA
jgi:hypothetical protein